MPGRAHVEPAPTPRPGGGRTASGWPSRPRSRWSRPRPAPRRRWPAAPAATAARRPRRRARTATVPSGPSSSSTPAGEKASSSASAASASCARDANGEADHWWWWCGRSARRSRRTSTRPRAGSRGDRRRELLEQLALALAQPARHLHVDDDAKVAVAVALQARHAAAAQDDDLAGLGPGRDLDSRRLGRASAPRSWRRAPRAAPARRAR